MLKKILKIVSITVIVLLLVVIILQQHTLKTLIAVPERSGPTSQYSSKPAQMKKSGDIVPIGTITFDNEYRVWILEGFIVPSVANYSFSYPSYDAISSAPFFNGAELSPTGKEFRICYDVTGECEPPVEIKFIK